MRTDEMDQVAKWKRRTAAWAVILFIISAGCVMVKGNALTLYQAQSQDLPVLLFLGIVICLVVFKAPAVRLPSRLPRWWVSLLSGFVIAALAAWGAYAVFGNYPLSRDEQMVVFDMAVYDHGRLATPLAPFWAPYARALAPDFLLNWRMPTGL